MPMVHYRRREIAETTGFDRGEVFTSKEDVYRYFTRDEMDRMGLGGADAPDIDPRENHRLSQRELNAMADCVITHRWHCDFGDAS